MPAILTIEDDAEKRDIACHTIVTIGRDKNSDVKINDRQVSRNHAMIRRLGEHDFYLIDSGSVNGSYVNDKRVSTPTLLKNGDQIIVGSAVITFANELNDADDGEEDETEATIVMQSIRIRKITVLVADIRGFTTLSEELEISTLSKVMSEWFRRVSDLVAINGGAVDKFIGDCVYARWEATDDENGSIMNSLKSAQQIKQISDELQAAHLEPPHQLQIGVGINTGEAAVGVGQDNTAIGDAVNLAFRLESATKECKKDIVLSQGSFQHLPETLWSGCEQEIMVKGKKDPIKVCGFSFNEIETFLKN